MIGYFYTCNAQRPNLSHLMQKNIKWQDECRCRIYDAAFGSRIGRSLGCSAVIARRLDRSNKRNMSGFLTWVQTAVLSLQRQSLTGRTQLLVAVQLQAGGGRCAAERWLAVVKCNLSALCSLQSICFQVNKEVQMWALQRRWSVQGRVFIFCKVSCSLSYTYYVKNI